MEDLYVRVRLRSVHEVTEARPREPRQLRLRRVRPRRADHLAALGHQAAARERNVEEQLRVMFLGCSLRSAARPIDANGLPLVQLRALPGQILGYTHMLPGISLLRRTSSRQTTSSRKICDDLGWTCPDLPAVSETTLGTKKRGGDV